jgi:hypothetical protein
VVQGGETGVADSTRRRSERPPAPAGSENEWLAAVADAASRDAGGVPVELLGEYLSLLADAGVHGRRPKRGELDAVGLLGRRAAEQGISARLHVSVRTVTYRLDRVKTPTGYNPTDPAHRFTLQAAVLGAKVLNWPREPLHIPG